ncbi:hypothetical protein M3Y97_00610300 [Aphelenchoides bicaudatus]|nr:hypothetical protein M3Y97_00610300 [Aphelenchoides bicaudatus]
MVFFKDQHSPRGFDELGQAQPVSRETDANPAWENQRMTYQQFVRSYDGHQLYSPVPGAVAPGALVDKDEDRGINGTALKTPMMTTAAVVSSLGSCLHGFEGNCSLN